MIFFSLIPLFSFLLIFLIVYSSLNPLFTYKNIRISFLYAALIIGVFIVILTELLSFYRILNFGWLLAGWGVLLLALGGYAWYNRLFRSLTKNTGRAFKDLILKERIIFAMLILLLISFLVALIYPPNNFDSMTYHMARVSHWQQNESISHYSTHILRQIVFPPFAEWIILHLQILTGGDRLANSVQLLFLSGCIIVVSLIARELGANRRQQVLAGVMACFIPMAVVQSNTTQNDIVVAFFVLGFVYLTVSLFRHYQFRTVIFAGIALGLAWLTKGTAYLFTAVFCGWYLLMILKDYRNSLKHLLKRALIYSLVPIIAITINSGHYYRNIFFSGSPLGGGSKGTANEAFGFKPIVLVTVENLMNHLPVTHSFKERVASKALKLGIDPDDPKYNLVGIKWMAEGFSFHEDYAQNFLHVILITICLFFYFFRKNLYNKSPDPYLFFILSLLFTTCLFCVLLKWQPWSNRLEMPLFMLFSIFIGMEIGRFGRRLQAVCYIPVVLYGFTALALNDRHPLLPIGHSIFYKPYKDFIYSKELLDLQKYLDGKPYTKIGIYIGLDSYDYPYYRLLRKSGGKTRILKHVFVQNNSAIYLDTFVPDAIISLETTVDHYTLGDKIYYRTKVFNETALFEAR